MIDTLLEKDLLPDFAIRSGIRQLLNQRIKEETRAAGNDPERHLEDYAEDLRRRAIAENTEAANEQHYEVPTEFYQMCLGPRLKYSGCLFLTGEETLKEAEEAMLALYVERGQLADGQEILELGCGWGSLSLYMAERFPSSQVTAVSNSRTQRCFIEDEARLRCLDNLRVITADMNSFDVSEGRFDRVVSIEMFEHMKNYERLLANISRWLKPDGKLFVHIFTHQKFAYHFEPKGESDWMARYFFSGGQMPSHDLLQRFQKNLRLVQDWKVNGTHYRRTAEHWLKNMDEHKARIMVQFAETYGTDHAVKWWAYWRIFFMSCAELWGYRGGEEWLISHYLFEQKVDEQSLRVA
jgi:cyclopropane-fatty-acyl-phospholipid synthase